MSTFRVQWYEVWNLDPMGVKATLLATTFDTECTIPNQRHNLPHFTTNNTDENTSTKSNTNDSPYVSSSESLNDAEAETNGDDEEQRFQTRYRHALSA